METSRHIGFPSGKGLQFWQSVNPLKKEPLGGAGDGEADTCSRDLRATAMSAASMSSSVATRAICAIEDTVDWIILH